MVAPIRVSKRTGWGRLPISKSRTKGQQAYRPIGNQLSTSERELTDIIEEAYNAIPTQMFTEAFDNADIAAYSRLVLSTLTSYASDIQEALTAQYVESATTAVNELRVLLSQKWSKIGKAADALPSEAMLEWGFDGKGAAAQSWAAEESSKLVTNMTVGQQDTVRQVINNAYTAGRTPATSAKVLVDTLNKVKPSTPTAQNLTSLFGTNMNGLTTRYEQAVVNRATALANSLAKRGITGQKAVDKITADTQKYADKLRRTRAKTIARTEIIRANNEGRLSTFNAAADQGLLSRQHSRKIWSTAPTDVCDICVPLNGQTVALDAPFSTGTLTPPAHPNCRCSFDIEPNVQAYEPPKAVGTGTPEDPYRFGRGKFTPEGRAASEITLPTETPAPSAPTPRRSPATRQPRRGTYDNPVPLSQETVQAQNGRLYMRDALEDFKPSETHTRVIKDLDSSAGKKIPKLIDRTGLDEVAEEKAQKILTEVDDLIHTSDLEIPEQGFQANIQGVYEISDEAAEDLLTADSSDVFYNRQHLRVRTFGSEVSGKGWKVEAALMDGTRFVPIDTATGEILMPRGMKFSVTTVDRTTKTIRVSYGVAAKVKPPMPLPTNVWVHELSPVRSIQAGGYNAWQDPILQTLREGEVIAHYGKIDGFDSLAGIPRAIITRQNGVILIEEVSEEKILTEIMKRGRLLSPNERLSFNQMWAQEGNIGQTINRTIPDIAAVRAATPKNAPTFTRQIVFSLKTNPQDAYWAKKYNMPDFRSGATGGRFSVFSYSGRRVDIGSLAHEYGHALDQSLTFGSGRIAETSLWKDAAQLDIAVSNAVEGRFKFGLEIMRTPRFGQKYVSSYATESNSPLEDFADSVALYLEDRRLGGITLDSQTGKKIRFKDAFPNRAKILDELFGI